MTALYIISLVVLVVILFGVWVEVQIKKEREQLRNNFKEMNELLARQKKTTDEIIKGLHERKRLRL